MLNRLNVQFKSILLLFVISLAPQLGYCVERSFNDVNKDYKEAVRLSQNEAYSEAIVLFKKVLLSEPNSVDALYNLGFCYLNASLEPDSALTFFQKAYALLTPDEHLSVIGVDLQLSIAKSYQYLYKQQQAIGVYNDLLKILPAEDTQTIALAKHEIEYCNNAIDLIKKPVDLKLFNLGPNVNSSSDDHSPLVSADESLLMYTSRRQTTDGLLMPDGQNEERIYSSNATTNGWGKSAGVRDLFPTNGHEAGVCLSLDGQELYVYRSDRDGANIYVSDNVNNNWTSPVKLPEGINSSYDETHASISPDKSTLYFTSNRPGGFGGLDIYRVRRLPNNEWGEPQNLGASINTQYDEETPIIHPDGKTLYFSSEGHNSMGQLDIFYSRNLNDSAWTAPLNIGYPINTPEDDLHFAPTTSANIAYYASSKFEGSLGGSDIYLVEYKEPAETWMVVVKGLINSTNPSLVENARITATRKSDNQVVGIYRPNITTGNYMLILEADDTYHVVIEGQGFETQAYDVVATRDMTYKKTGAINNVANVTLLPVTPVVETDSKEDEPILASSLFYNEKGEPYHTVQILALKEPVSSYKVFANLEPELINEFRCKNGWFLYAYGSFDSYRLAKKGKKKVLETGLWQDAFVRTTKQYLEVLNPDQLPK